MKTGETYETGLEKEDGFVIKRRVKLIANSSTEILDATALEVLNSPEGKKMDIVLGAYLFPAAAEGTGGEADRFAFDVFRASDEYALDEPPPLARCINWPEPLKYVDFPPADLLEPAVCLTEGQTVVDLLCRVPVKGVVLYAEPDWKNGVSEEKKLEAEDNVKGLSLCQFHTSRLLIRMWPRNAATDQVLKQLRVMLAEHKEHLRCLQNDEKFEPRLTDSSSKSKKGKGKGKKKSKSSSDSEASEDDEDVDMEAEV